MPRITRRIVPLEVAFLGSGAIEERRPGQFIGGVPDPNLSSSFGFNVLKEVEDEDGIGPEDAYDGRLQINIWGGSEDFRALGRYFVALAELDAKAHPGFHEHLEDLISEDGRTRVHVIVRKPLP